jgi:hypothetical protein
VGQSRLLEVSDPKSLKYGQHLSRDEVNEVVAPNPDAVAKVVDWIATETGVNREEIEIVGSGDFLRVVLPISKVGPVFTFCELLRFAALHLPSCRWNRCFMLRTHAIRRRAHTKS